MKENEEKENPSRLREGTENVEYTAYIWYNRHIKYRRYVYVSTTAKDGIKSVQGNM